MDEPASIVVTEAEREDASAIATIHLSARRQAMPYLRRVHTMKRPGTILLGWSATGRFAWWVVRQRDHVAAYLRLDGENLEHLYVLPQWQGHGFGSALLDKAKALSPDRLVLWTFQRNLNARAFYEARGFRAIKQTDGENEEDEPDVLYEWRNAG